MARSNSDMDKIMDLFLYLIPKYLNKINGQRNNREIIRNISLEKAKSKSSLNDSEKKDIKKVISKSESLEKDKKSEKSEKDSCTKENNAIKHEVKNSKNVNRESYEKEGDGTISKLNEFSKEQENKNQNETNIVKNEICDSCIDGMEKILKKLVGEKVDIGITDSTMFLLNEATISSVENTIVKLKTTRNTTVIIPIQEIVAIRCNSIYGIKFDDNCNLDKLKELCKKEEKLREYFQSKIGKRIFLQTKGDGAFKYISNRIITGTGRGVVIIEGTMVISLCKIVLIEEVV